MIPTIALLLLHYGYFTLEADPLVVAFNRMAEEIQRGKWETASKDIRSFQEQIQIARNSYGLDLETPLSAAIARRDKRGSVEVLAAIVETAIREKLRLCLEEKFKKPALVMPRLAVARAYYRFFLSGNPMQKDRLEGTNFHAQILKVFDTTTRIASHAARGAPTPQQIQEFGQAIKEFHRLLLTVYPFIEKPGEPPAANR